MTRSRRLSHTTVPCPLCGIPCGTTGDLVRHMDSCVASSMQFGMATGASPAVAAELAARRAETLARTAALKDQVEDLVAPEDVLFGSDPHGHDHDQPPAQLQAGADSDLGRVTPSQLAPYDL